MPDVVLGGLRCVARCNTAHSRQSLLTRLTALSIRGCVVWGCEADFAHLVYGVALVYLVYGVALVHLVHLVHLVDLVVEELAYDCELVDDDEHEEEGEAERLRVDRHGLDDLVRVRDRTWG